VSTLSSNNKKEKLTSKAARIINSIMAFVIAYMVIIFLFSLFTALIAKLFGFDSNISFAGVKFDLGSHKWDKLNVSVVYGFGTFATALLGFAFFYLYTQFEARLNLANLVLLWGSVIAFSIVAAQALLPCLEPDEQRACYTGLGVVFAWFSIPIPLLYVICFFFMVFLAFFSIYTSKPFLAFSYSFSKVSKADRKRKYYIETVVIPYLVACALLLVYIHYSYPAVNFRILNIVYMFCIGLSLSVSFLVININDMRSDEVRRYKNLQSVSPALFILFILLLVFFITANKGFYLPF
jgi:hypothetical protein